MTDGKGLDSRFHGNDGWERLGFRVKPGMTNKLLGHSRSLLSGNPEQNMIGRIYMTSCCKTLDSRFHGNDERERLGFPFSRE